jgi:hypothetical protein
MITNKQKVGLFQEKPIDGIPAVYQLEVFLSRHLEKVFHYLTPP